MTIGEARRAVADVLWRFRIEGSTAAPIVFGAHRRPEGVIIPFQLYAELSSVIEDLQLAELVRVRATAGLSVPLAEVAAGAGLEPDDYR